LQWVTSRDNAGTVDSGNAAKPYRDSLRGATTPPSHKSDNDRRGSLDPQQQQQQQQRRMGPSTHIKSLLDEEMDVTEMPLRHHHAPDTFHSTDLLQRDDSSLGKSGGGGRSGGRRRGSGFWGGEALVTLEEEEEARRKDAALDSMTLEEGDADSSPSFSSESRHKLRASP
jgi:hypothetical protein